ncbi:MAG TPA: hypothetical protein VFZ09_31150 [Archangium sp.]|uniref:hypothetical protein n=1 Tax=Archangium sp. TaxID=1872627 RepID=UPI002E30AEE5|nr:hypothetical protein [Archangium sp.]HEX5750725.1 hypothetical protein [Archangium sp.]
MSIRDDKKNRNMAGAEDADTKKAGRKLTDEPGPDFRVASGGESEEEHAFTTDSPRWGSEGESREERGYPREGGEDIVPPRK